MTTPTPEVVEAVAKAIHKETVGNRDWDNATEWVKARRRIQAIAAIAEFVKQTGAGK